VPAAVAFSHFRRQAQAVARYLHEREMITGVYDPRWRNIETPRGSVRAVAYVADRSILNTSASCRNGASSR